MTWNNIIVAILTAVLIALGANVGLEVHNTDKIGQQFTVVCAEHRTLGRIFKDELRAEIQSNLKLLPRANIPGITHQELVNNSEEKIRRETQHVAELELIARETC